MGAAVRRAARGRRGGGDQRRLDGHHDAEGHRAAPRAVGPGAAGGEVPPPAQAALQEPVQVENHTGEQKSMKTKAFTSNCHLDFFPFRSP